MLLLFTKKAKTSQMLDKCWNMLPQLRQFLISATLPQSGIPPPSSKHRNCKTVHASVPICACIGVDAQAISGQDLRKQTWALHTRMCPGMFLRSPAYIVVEEDAMRHGTTVVLLKTNGRSSIQYYYGPLKKQNSTAGRTLSRQRRA